jgi:serine/threonine-protein kinase
VAIKLVRRGGEAARQVLHRFRLERQILAALDHPNIAKLLDGGSLPDGSPFLVLELVRGRPIDRWCDEHGATLRRRIELTLEVCAAVAAAHRRLIVHRDLKPGNILVTESGAPKLLDFGIAKLLDPSFADFELARTRTGFTALTLAYASPEQLGAEPVTTATDVYSLGVVLYELLTGRGPYGDGLSDLDLARAIAEREPRLPSASVPAADPRVPPSRRKELAGDLDAILLKALRKEPAARYPSVEALADDLRRYLDGRPVEARRGSRGYRLGKLLRRHRLAAALAALVVLSLAALAAGSALASRRLARERDATAHERDVAARERDTARATTDFLVKLFAASDPAEARGQEVTARELLARGASRIDRELGGQPGVQAALLDTLGRVHANLGLYDAAREQLGRSLELRATLGQAESGEATRTLAELGWSEVQAGRFEEGERRLREALARERLTPAGSVFEAQLLSQLGGVVGYRERFEEAQRLLEQAVAMRRDLPPGDDRVLESSLNNLALLQAASDRWGEAATNFRQVVEVLVRRYGEEHPSVVIVRTNASWALAGLGDWAAAEREAADAERIAAKILGEAHPATARARFFRGWALTGLGRFDEAEAPLRASLATRRSLAASGVEVMQSFQGIARMLWWSGRKLEALATLEEAERLAERAAGESGGRAPGEVEADRADLLLALDRPAVALPLAERALERAAADPRSLPKADARVRLAEVRLALGEPAAARPLIESALALVEGDDLDSKLLRRRILVARARLEAAEGERDQADRTFGEAALLERFCAPGDPARGEAARRRAELDRPPAAASARSR